MSLINAKDEFSKYFNSDDPDYVGDITSEGAQARTDSEDRVRTAWTAALRKKLPGIFPASANVTAACDIFEAAYDGATLASFQAAMNSMAASLGTGMADVTLNPPLGFAATPPTVPFLPATTTQDKDIMCQELDSQLDTWLGTGTATDNSPPNPTVNWS